VGGVDPSASQLHGKELEQYDCAPEYLGITSHTHAAAEVAFETIKGAFDEWRRDAWK
jgi:hypothetical protein